MSRLKSCEDSEISAETLALLEPVRVGGKLAPVYRQMANSSPALAAYLQMEKALAGSNLSEQEIEAVKLSLSQVDNCEFCLAVHVVKAKKAGLNAEQLQAIRMGEATGIKRLDVIVKTVRGFFLRPGTLSASDLAELKESGLDDQDLVDMVLAASAVFLTNSFNHINDTDLVFPPAPPLPE